MKNDRNERILETLYHTILSKKNANPKTSYSAQLLSKGPKKIAQKFGEEAIECIIEAATENKQALIAESADVLYHLLVLWVSNAVEPEDVWSELHRRQGISGLTEKASRTS